MMPHDVTQADREAQATLYSNVGKPGMAEEILSGEMDDHPGVQAFAAHRLAAIAEERARVVAWLGRQAEAIDRLSEEAITEQSRRDLIVMSGARRECAKALERGDHIQEK